MKLEEFVELCAEADDLIKVVKKQTCALQGRSPTSVKAAAVHYLARQRDLPVTLHKLYLIYGCVQKTIIKIEKIISSTQ